MNRGIARRTVFETRRDVRKFLALLVFEVRAGRIELIAFSILTTHFHLVVRSRTAELDKVMQRVLNTYVRYFNRTRRRDGPLFRSRYRAKAVDSMEYLRTLIRYVDQNAPKARLTADPQGYPHGSARLYAQARRPIWLATALVDKLLGRPDAGERPAAYALAFSAPLSFAESALIEARLASPSALEDDWDHLVKAAPPQVLAWMQTKARLADGTKPGLPYVVAADVLDEVASEERRCGRWQCAVEGTRRRDAWPVVRVGLLRDLAGMTLAEISRGEGCTPNMASRRVEQHARLLNSDQEYAARASRVAVRCLRDR